VEYLTDKIASEFFEIGSEQRLSIILHLNEKDWSISPLSKKLEATITEVHRNFGRLQKAGLILKNLDGTYRLTVFGKLICSQIPAIAFVSDNRKYFENHNFGNLPTKFHHRVGELYEQKRIKGFVRILEKWKEIQMNATQYIYNILTNIHTIFAENAIVPEERKTIFKIKNFNKYVKEDLLVRRMIDKVSVVVILNEKEACIMFPNLDGQPDMSEMFYSVDPQFHEWCLDYFNHCWDNSSSFKENKLH